jgi:uncharacterized repeat protein (TIGR01451 family)
MKVSAKWNKKLTVFLGIVLSNIIAIGVVFGIFSLFFQTENTLQANALSPHGNIQLTKTAHLATGFTTCAASPTISAPVPSGAQIYYCYKIENPAGSPSKTYTSFTFVDTHPLGVVSTTSGISFTPGNTAYVITGPLTITTSVNSTATLTANWSDGSSLGQDTPSASTSVVLQFAQLALFKTVGTNANTCSSNNQESMTVPLSTTVYYCYRIRNTGYLSLTNFVLTDSHISLPAIVVPNNLILDPNIEYLTSPVAYLVTGAVTNVATVTASSISGIITATDLVNINIGAPTASVRLTVTVSTNNACGTTDSISVLAGTQVYYCYTLLNEGQIALQHHTLNTGGANAFTAAPYFLAVGAVTQTVRGPFTINSATYHEAFWTAFISGTATTATGYENASVTITTTNTATPTPTTVLGGATATPTPTQSGATATPTPQTSLPDLAVNIASQDLPFVGKALEVTSLVINAGSAFAPNVRFTVTLPNNASFQSFSASGALSCPNVPTAGTTGGTLTCVADNGMVAGSTQSVNVTLVPINNDILTISMSASTTGNESTMANNRKDFTLPARRAFVYLPMIKISPR